jgi:hypothetical protein
MLFFEINDLQLGHLNSSSSAAHSGFAAAYQRITSSVQLGHKKTSDQSTKLMIPSFDPFPGFSFDDL